MFLSKSKVQEIVRGSGVYQHLDRYRLEMVRSIHQRRDEGYTKRIRIGKSGRIEMHWTHSHDSQFVLSLGSRALVFREVLGEQSLLFL